MSQTLTPEVPFAARAAMLPDLVDLTTLDAVFDPEQQLNVRPDGTPWHTTPMAASCTDTNQDGQGDDVNDPYYAPAS